MTRKNAPIEAYCKTCDRWFTVVGEEFVTECPYCKAPIREVKCNRCGMIWKVNRPVYPKQCTRCKSPYYNRKRVQTRKGIND